MGLPPGGYFTPLVPLMTAILAARPGDDVSAPRQAINEVTEQRSGKLGQVQKLIGNFLMNPSGKPVIL